MKLIIASGNPGKIREIREILAGKFDEIVSMKDAGILHETVEDGETFAQNAEKKAREIMALSGCAALADDSGICVTALHGAPGVYSARFSGVHGDDEANNRLLVEKLKGAADRSAHYECAVCLVYPDGKKVEASGQLWGEITETPSGSGGFGYDPYFYLPSYGCTVACLSEEEKNRISHRGKALRALLAKL